MSILISKIKVSLSELGNKLKSKFRKRVTSNDVRNIIIEKIDLRFLAVRRNLILASVIVLIICVAGITFNDKSGASLGLFGLSIEIKRIWAIYGAIAIYWSYTLFRYWQFFELHNPIHMKDLYSLIYKQDCWDLLQRKCEGKSSENNLDQIKPWKPVNFNVKSGIPFVDDIEKFPYSVKVQIRRAELEQSLTKEDFEKIIKNVGVYMKVRNPLWADFYLPLWIAGISGLIGTIYLIYNLACLFVI